ncbi:MAG TPA: NADPH:quinone reductase [Thermoanaerobaculia bacterium]|nr:NADPH:quinone reductase [Thermoanaerobaculia bacterium]
MKAAWYESKGPARAVLQVGEQARPEVAAGEVLVRVHTSAVNPSDTKARGGWRGRLAMPFPRVIPHQDGAGVIEGVGEGVEPSRVAQRVWVFEAQLGRAFGTAAEYVALPSRNAVPLPAGVDFVEGACLGIPAMTAHRCVFADGAVSGRTVLVTGGASAVGFYAIQLAVWGGARVLATVSSEAKAEAARAAGAHEVIDYRREDVAERVRGDTAGAGVDRVVEVAFGSNLASNLQVLKPNGVIATYSSDAVAEPTVPFGSLLAKDITVRFVLVYAMPWQAHEAAIVDISRCLEAAAIRRPPVRRFPLEQIAAAHEALEDGQITGKAILELSPNAQPGSVAARGTLTSMLP